MSNSTLAGNSSGSGGGLFNYYGTLSLSDDTLDRNTAGATGGGLYNIGSVTIDNSTLSNNTADGGGGGIVNPLGAVVASNTTLYGNTATGGNGGGLLNNGGTTTLVNVTVAANRASAGGGIDVGSGAVSLQDTLVAGNVRGAAPATSRDDVAGALNSSSSYNLIGDGMGMTGIGTGSQHNQVGSSAGPINALFGPLADNGGTTRTVALLIGSPAIDLGSNALAVDSSGKPLTKDQRAKSRVFNSVVDIGAFEAQP